MKVTFSSIVYTLFSRFVLLVFGSVMIIPALILVFVVPQRYRYNTVYFYFSYMIYRFIIQASLLPIRITGKEYLPAGPAIYIANHSSSLDIPVLGSLVGTKLHFWIAMKWLTRFWIFRLFLPRTAILVDMEGQSNGNVRSLIRILQLVKERQMSIMIFPEGGRYTDGTVHEFYGGFVLLARKTGLPIIPVRIFNLQKVYPPNTFWVHYYPVKVVIGEPMRPGDDETDEACKERVHKWFIDQEG